MNFALPAAIVFLIVLPGFVFRAGLKRVEGTKLDYSPFGQVVTSSVIWASILHAGMLALSYGVFDKEVRVDILLRLLSSRLRDADYVVIERDILWIAFYSAGSLILSSGLSALFQKAVSRFGLDIHSS